MSQPRSDQHPPEDSEKRRPRLSPDEYSRYAKRNAQRRSARPLLDPYGIYGTRTVARRRAARRRRALQNLTVVLFFAVLGTGVWAWWKTPRVLRFAPNFSLQLPARPSAAPVVARGPGTPGAISQLWIPTETGSLFSVDLKTLQKTRWPLGEFALSSPLINQQQIVVGAADGALHRFDGRKPKAPWRFGFESAVLARPVLWKNSDGENIIAASDAGEIASLNLATRRLNWRAHLQAPVGQGVVVLNAVSSTQKSVQNKPARVYFSLGGNWRSRGGIACLDARSGKILWRADLRAAHLSAPAVEVGKDGKVWIYTAGDDGAVFRLDGANGQRDSGGWKTFVAAQARSWSLWESSIPAREPVAAVLRGEPLLKEYSWGTRLVLGGEDGALRCFDAENGRPLWTFDTGVSVQHRPATLRLAPDTNAKQEHDFLLVPGKDRCFVLDARTGQRVWEWQTGEALSAAPFVDGDSAWAVTQSGRILRFQVPALEDIVAMLPSV